MATLVIGTAIISIIFGILVLAFPRFLRYFVGIYFLVVGIIMLLGDIL